MNTEVPASILAIVERGLATAPEARWAAMEGLLEALSSDREFVGDPEQDMGVSRWARLLMSLGLSAVAVINAVIIVALELRRDEPSTTRDAVVAGVIGASITCIIVFLARRPLFKNSINRRFVLLGLVLTISPLINRCIGHLLAAPVAYVLVLDMLLAVSLSVLAGALMVRWLWYLGAVFAVGVAAGVASPAHAQSILAVCQCVSWIIGVRCLLSSGARAVRSGDAGAQHSRRSSARASWSRLRG